MKILIAAISFLFTISFCSAQNQGSFKSKEIVPKAGIMNLYIYRPPKHLLIPDKLQVSVMYQSGRQSYLKSFPLTKNGNGFSFSFKAPDSTAVLIFSVVDTKKKIVDNNNEAGYIRSLFDQNGKQFIFEKIALAGMLKGYAPFFLKLKETPNSVLIKMYEDTYRLHPELRKQDSYIDYLTVLYKEKEAAVKDKLLDYANQKALEQENEASWINAIKVYQLLNLEEKKQKVEKKAIATYPNGLKAKEIFWGKFNTAMNPTELSIKASMDEYINRFNDTSENSMDIFYRNMIFNLLNKNEWNGTKKYAALMHNKLYVASLYNNFGWKLSGERIDSVGNNLDQAQLLSRQALGYVEELIKTPAKVGQQRQELQCVYNNYLDNYALILYKLGQYDSAFYYQDGIYQQGNELDAAGLERYAVYAEKVKGINYTRQLIEKELLGGLNSPILLIQLHSIYRQLNLQEDEFKKLQEKADLLTKHKSEAAIRERFGTIKAKGFELKNLQGEKVTLMSFKNKVVVLDFWATWCGPCRASFPEMQALINKYKDDNEVVFLFIDVWENKSAEKMQEMAAKFMNDNKYGFNVLLDVKDKVVGDYRVDAIPAKFIIDKKGDIVFMGDPSNISLEIENAKH